MSSPLSLNPVKNAPVFWGAFGGALLLFSLLRLLPMVQIEVAQTEIFALDSGYARFLPENWGSYSIFPEEPQTFGPRVLTRYLLAVGGNFFGTHERAGVWISLFAVVATMAGVCKLAYLVFPSREFVILVGLTAASASAVQFHWSTDPTLALGSALVAWSVYFFLSALHLELPHRIFPSSLLIGLAAYIRIELVILWIPMALYLFVSAATPSPAKAKGLPLVSMALGGLLQLAMILWPMIDRNMVLTKSTPLLPGFDAERILGIAGTHTLFSFSGRLLEGIRILTLEPGGLGVFLGMLWIPGLVLIHLRFRESSTPFAWLSLILPAILLFTGISPLTGMQSYRESLLILAPLLIPLGAYPLTYLLFHFLQTKEMPARKMFYAWSILTLLSALIALLPTLRQFPQKNNGNRSAGDAAFLEWFEAEMPLRNLALATDRPGLFLVNGKMQVHGLHGETNWKVLALRNADGSINAARLNEYLRQKEVTLLHLASTDNPLLEQMRAEPNSPVFREVNVTPPHRVFRLQWSVLSGRN